MARLLNVRLVEHDDAVVDVHATDARSVLVHHKIIFPGVPRMLLVDEFLRIFNESTFPAETTSVVRPITRVEVLNEKTPPSTMFGHSSSNVAIC